MPVMRSFARRHVFVPAAVALGAATACVLGSVAAVHYHRAGLTLTHYDARGHLVVARRIIDSITPGWQQIGAVWLPLPHLVNAIPVQVDFLYRTGASGVAISIASFAIAAATIASIVLTITESAAAAIAAAAVFVLNPNVLYLQSTPMTEPLLIGLTTLSVAALLEDRREPVVGMCFALSCLTRYEAWPITAAALTFAGFADWRRSLRLAAWPAVAIAGFAIFSRVVVGRWFVGGDFFVPENKAMGDAWMSVKEIAW